MTATLVILAAPIALAALAYAAGRTDREPPRDQQRRDERRANTRLYDPARRQIDAAPQRPPTQP